MTSVAEVAPIEALLAPIPGENPAGEDVRYTPLYDQIREARRADEDLPMGQWVRETKTAEWPKVIRLATDALATKSKDLQLCAWFMEAALKVHGFHGLRDALRLTRGILEAYWDGLYPELDDGDPEARAVILEWLNEKLPLPVRQIPITRAASGEQYSYTDWLVSTEFVVPDSLEGLNSSQLKAVNETKERAAAEKKLTSADFGRVKEATPRSFYEDVHPAVVASLEELKELDRVVDEKFGSNAPGFRALMTAIEDVHAQVERIFKEKGGLQPVVEEAAGGEESAEGGSAEGNGAGPSAPGSLTAAGAIRNRQEALRRLAEVAEYFRLAEPHSPVGYVLQRAINWSQMPLDTWLRTVIKNDDVLSRLSETIGLDSKPDE